MRIEPLGDSALLVHLGERVDGTTGDLVRAAYNRLTSSPLPGAVDVVAGLASVAIHFDVLSEANGFCAGPQPPRAIIDRIRERLSATSLFANSESRVVEVPVCYGGDLGPDLDFLSTRAALDSDDVIAIHSTGQYSVQMIGFAPGFPYLSGLDPRLATPRRDSPRTRVPAGSVAIGGDQTGIYSVASPGGWHIIGRTPLRLFDADRSEPALLRVGDRVRFRTITVDEFRALDEEQ